MQRYPTITNNYNDNNNNDNNNNNNNDNRIIDNTQNKPLGSLVYKITIDTK